MFFSLSFKTPQYAHQSMRFFFGRPFSVGTDVSTFLDQFVHLIANAQIKDITRDPPNPPRRNHPRVELPTKKIHCFQTSGTSVIYLFTSSELGKYRLQNLTKTIVMLNLFETVSTGDFKYDCPRFHPRCAGDCFGHTVKKWFYKETAVSYLSSSYFV